MKNRVSGKRPKVSTMVLRTSKFPCPECFNDVSEKIVRLRTGLNQCEVCGEIYLTEERP
jgi:ribosomal protein L37AE/L43A